MTTGHLSLMIANFFGTSKIPQAAGEKVEDIASLLTMNASFPEKQNSLNLLEGALAVHPFRVLARWRLFLLVEQELQDMALTEAPATPDSVSSNDSFPRQPIDGLDVDFEQLRYLRWSYDLIH